MTILVSIIMPTFNSVKFLSQSIESVLGQSCMNWELIIVDDCSLDSSYEIAEKYSRMDSRIKLYKLERNSGAAAARNFAVSMSNGRFIAFLDSDDEWLPSKLSKQVGLMLDKNIPFSFTAYHKINLDGNVVGYIGVPDKETYRSLLKTCTIGCLTAVYDTRFFGKLYMRTDTKREDYSLWLMILKKTKYAYGINDCLAKYRIYDNQSSANKLKMAKENWHLYRNIEKLGFFYSIYIFVNYIVRGVLRLKAPYIARLLGFLD